MNYKERTKIIEKIIAPFLDKQGKPTKELLNNKKKQLNKIRQCKKYNIKPKTIDRIINAE